MECLTGHPDRLGNSILRDPLPPLLDDALPSHPGTDLIENVRNQDARSPEGWLAVADGRASNDIPRIWRLWRGFEAIESNPVSAGWLRGSLDGAILEPPHLTPVGPARAKHPVRTAFWFRSAPGDPVGCSLYAVGERSLFHTLRNAPSAMGSAPAQRKTISPTMRSHSSLW